MLIVELNRKGEALKEILMGICLNSGKENVSMSATRIVVKDLKAYKPTKLYHCYKTEELESILTKLNKLNESKFLVKEIIPTDGDFGIIRELNYNYDQPKTLVSQVWSKYRYYIMHEANIDGENVSSVVTYNPEIRELVNINVALSETLRVNCGTMQFGNVKDLSRLMSIKNVIDENEGTYVVYTLDEED